MCRSSCHFLAPWENKIIPTFVENISDVKQEGGKRVKKTYQRLPESELDIMLVLWNGTPPMTRPEIEKVINTKKNLASTTILSLLTRLESKNFVEVTKQGKLNLYTPLVSQSDYQAHESQSVLEKLYGNSLKKFVTSLYQGKKISSEEIHELSDFLKELEDREE